MIENNIYSVVTAYIFTMVANSKPEIGASLKGKAEPTYII